MGNFCQFLTELSAWDTTKFSFPDDNFSKISMNFHQTWCVHWYCEDVV